MPAEPTVSANIDRRTFLIRNAVIGAAAVMTGTKWTPDARAQQAAKEAAAPKLAVLRVRRVAAPVHLHEPYV